MSLLFGILIGILALVGAALAVLTSRFRRAEQRADEEWDRFEPEPFDLEPVERLTITPLIDAQVAGAGLTSEAGVSYLIHAGNARVLFDLGYNPSRESPSPLQSNAAALGVDLEAVDAVVVSHRHLDHVGGFQAQRAHSFVLL